MSEHRVVATAGHVDHGKSSLIVRLTGIDPDRWAEEKRRGLTIDLGYAWCTLPSGREIGFVDVPGHERFVANMLAGVGPVRLVLFVVAANEGWRPQSEEHLAILDVLGVDGGVVALTKRDLVHTASLAGVVEDVRARLSGTALQRSPIVPTSATTGDGLDELRSALDAIVRAAPQPEATRTRLFVDRSFTIAGAGTVATGTLAGGCLSVGDEIEVYPEGPRTRIRSLQTHKRSEDRACPVRRVAVNLSGVARDAVERGDVLGTPATWLPTTVFEGTLRAVRALGHPITPRGAYTVHAGAAESDARVRIHGRSRIEEGQEAFVRIALGRPLVLDVFDRYVLRESGRAETVGGGTVLDVAPPRRAGAAPEERLARRAAAARDELPAILAEERLARRAAAARDELPAILAEERGAVRAGEAYLLTGSPGGATETGDWLLAGGLWEGARAALLDHLAAHHRQHPREEGAPVATAREVVAAAIAPVSPDPDLVDALIERTVRDGGVERAGAALRLPSHRGGVDAADPDLRRLLDALRSPDPTQPPGIGELVAAGIGRDVLDAAVRAGLVVRIAPDLVFLREVVDRAQAVVAGAAGTGITVSAFREALGTSRKYALPLLAWFDQRGITRRQGDLRFPRG